MSSRRKSRYRKVLSPKNFWNEMAPYYDEFVASTRYKFFTPEDEVRFFDELFRGRRLILDLGCGTGRTIELLSERGYELVGLDISGEMLRVARGHGLGCLVLADIAHLPFRDSTFDAAFSLHGGLSQFKTFGERLRAFKEIARVLKSGGLVFIDVPSPYREDKGEVYLVEWPAGDRKIRTVGYALWLKDALKILKESKFELSRLLGGYDLKKEFDKRESRRLVIIAVKTEMDRGVAKND